MKGIKRPKLPRGLRWRSNSPFIWFSWRDSRGKQHQQSTETADPAEALSNKLKFLAKQEHEREDSNSSTPADPNARSNDCTHPEHCTGNRRSHRG